MKFFILICLAVSALQRPVLGASPDEAFNRYAAHLSNFRTVRFNSVFFDRNAEQMDYTNSLKQEWKIDFSGMQLWRKTTASRVVSETGRWQSSAGYSETVVKPEDVSHVTVGLVAAPQNSGATDQNAGLDRIAFSSYCEVPENAWRRDPGFLYVGYALGYFRNGNEYSYIPSMVTSAQKHVLSAEGHAGLLGVSCISDGISFEMWFDPSKDHALKELQLSRVQEPASSEQFSTASMVVERFELVDSVWVPAVFLVEETYVSSAAAINTPRGVEVDLVTSPRVESGAVQKYVAEVTLSGFDFSPIDDHEFGIQTRIPEGTPVSMQDAPHLLFAYRGGEIVGVPEASLQSVRGLKFQNSPLRRNWLVIINGLLLIVAALLAWKTATRRKQ